jgi:hypothetical protein
VAIPKPSRECRYWHLYLRGAEHQFDRVPQLGRQLLRQEEMETQTGVRLRFGWSSLLGELDGIRHHRKG